MAINFNKVPAYIKREINNPAKIIRIGQKNRYVKQIQEWLEYHRIRTSIDGIYGPATASCVSDFQQSRKLNNTGTVDAETWKKLVEPMIKALKPPKITKRQTAPSTVALVAKQHVKQKPQEIGGANRGPWVRLYCNGNDGIEWAWCAGFVTLIMQQAYFYRDEKSPIKGSVSCDSLAAQGKETDLFVGRQKVTSGSYQWEKFGGSCIFLKRRTETDWTHTGIATASESKEKELVFYTIEGNTNDEGDREGYEACVRKRSIKSTHYDFIAFE